jgi:N-acetylmuramoyl-L-alanine amidase
MTFRRILVTALLAALCGCAAPKKITTEKPAPQPAAPTAPHPAPAPVPQVPTPLPAPGFPPIPGTAPDAPLHISVAYPVSQQLIQNVDSNFIFGSTGNGNASLTIDGFPIPAAKNGAFLAFLPMPEHNTYHLTAERGMDRDSMTLTYRSPKQEETSKKIVPDKDFTPRYARISKGSDTLQTGNDVACGARTPDGNREWFFPQGTMLHLTEHEGKYYKIKLDSNTFGWVADSNFDFNGPAQSGEWRPGRSSEGRMVTLRTCELSKGDIFPSTGYIDLRLPGNHYPFQITAQPTSLRIRIYTSPTISPALFDTTSNDPLFDHFKYDSTSGDVDFTVFLTKPVWGYKAFYSKDGSLDIRIRRPPEINKNHPLKGIRIMLDPGHPPGGAIGPTGLMEREANLAVAEKVREQLIKKGAIVLMTHETLDGLVSSVNQTEELDARSALGVQSNVDLMVSIHNNAFPDGTDPFLKYGTSTYYFHPFSEQLAADLDKEIASVTGISDMGAKFKSLAVCRPTWMPCALTESLYMMFPDQENALQDSAFLEKLAAAHVLGIEDFLREENR